MYYRRKILLSLIQKFGGTLSRTELQKLLFLFCNNQLKPVFHFIPYKYGCFSYQANQDISTMIKYEQIEEVNSKWKVIDKQNYINQLKDEDRYELVKLYNNFKDIKGDELIKFVYKNYPFYAINSEIASKLLDDESLNTIINAKPINNQNIIYTIGYEGKSVEEYVNLLIKEDIKVLCDIRKNPISMKYGFSKNQLKNIVENLGIKYIHIPELGIESDKRRNLETKIDYDILFDEYENNSLVFKDREISLLSEQFFKFRRIALTCFEADFNYCHRSRVAGALITKLNNKFALKHI